MTHELVHPPKARPGDRIAVLSPSFAAAGASQICTSRRCAVGRGTGLVVAEYPTTRKVGASARERAADVGAAVA